jgi:hypothetical protein
MVDRVLNFRARFGHERERLSNFLANGGLMRLFQVFCIWLSFGLAGVCSSQETASEENTATNSEVATPSVPESSAKSAEESKDPSSTLDMPRQPPPNLEPLASRVRAVRAIRFGVVVVSILSAMLTTVALMKINRLSHGRYAGRIWWLGILLVPAWLLVGVVWAWNNELWAAWLDGTLLL